MRASARPLGAAEGHGMMLPSGWGVFVMVMRWPWVVRTVRTVTPQVWQG